MFMGHTGWRHVKTGRIEHAAPNDSPGPDWRPVIENVDYHADEDHPYKLIVISLWQPFASLLFTVKRHETRPWRWPDKLLNVPIGIHATAAMPRVIRTELDPVCCDEFGGDWRATLPRASILGTVTFDHCGPTEGTPPESAEDVYAGDWDAGRFATRVRSRSRWAKPIPAKGNQGFWRINEDQLNASAREAYGS